MKEIISSNFYNDVKNIIINARNKVYHYANSTMIYAYWDIGERIIIEEQGGKERADYGKKILHELSLKLTEDFGSGYDERNLRRMRQFYQTFPIRDALRPELTWTHYRSLLMVENEKARQYYLKESVEQNWGTRALDRQISSLTYERILSSQNKMEVKKHEDDIARQDVLMPQDIIKDPYVLEFLDLPANTGFYEKDLEKALIDNLQKFILELGRGFAFIARQQRISTETSNFFIDLTFYNYLLKCFVIIDLKIGKLTHQDIGQMDMYVRMFDDLKRGEGDNPTIGLILCTEKDETVVRYSILAENRHMFASKYKLYLPTEEELIKELEAERRQIEMMQKDK
ncbi:PDDEXK nuclease domain-containing protein [Limibacterium fermenti]|uniref:PDDEXK nuclease domain-containing protein n=1 Tax=Limibacterium fermenti TaxID=3229863 RepID=UPI003A6DD34C